MKFRYTFEKDWVKKVLTPSVEGLTMGAYDHIIEKGWKIVKREIEVNGVFKEIL